MAEVLDEPVISDVSSEVGLALVDLTAAGASLLAEPTLANANDSADDTSFRADRAVEIASSRHSALADDNALARVRTSLIDWAPGDRAPNVLHAAKRPGLIDDHVVVRREVEPRVALSGVATERGASRDAPMLIPTDDRFTNQWHLDNLAAGELDLNVVLAWDDYSGAGVTVTVIDDGFDFSHSDIAPNYDTMRDWDFAGNDADASPAAAAENHGTATIGIVGAALNGTGVVGVAHGVDLIGFRTNFALAVSEDAIDATANVANAHFEATDIVSMSFAATNVFDLASEYIAMTADFAGGSALGRAGLGTVYVKAVGNNRGSHDANAEMRDASIHTITVAATLANGHVAGYSTPGASVTVAAFGSPGFAGGTIFTTDRVGATGYNTETSGNGGDFTASFSGTSAATPMVAGIAALMLEANLNLGWRDVQTIFAYTARHVGSTVGSAATGSEQSSGAFGSAPCWLWNAATNWNGGPLHFSNDYGFGLVDATAAVRLAETWRISSTTANQAATFEDGINGNNNVPDGGFLDFIITETEDILIEHTSIELDQNVGDLGDLEIYLTSPAGTTSKLIADIGGTSAFRDRWTFASNTFRGETSAGTWTLQVRDDEIDGQRISVRDGDLRTFGAALTPGNLFVFTDEFSDYVGIAGHATVFAGGGGTDVINAAAVTSNSVVDLPGNACTIDGVAITAMNIDVIYTGDGDDTIIGDGGSDELRSGRGNDRIEVNQGIDGANTYDGGPGIDTIDVSGTFAIGATFDLAAGTMTDGPANVDQMLNFEHLIGTANADTIIGSDSDNSLEGGAGGDTIYGGDGTDALFGGAGDDSLFGDFGNDALIGGDGADMFFGGDGVNDLMITGDDGAIDHFDGGSGIADVVSYFSSGTGVTVNLGNQAANAGAAAGETYVEVEGTRGAGAAANTLTGDATGNVLVGGSASDEIFGGAGSDIIYGGAGNDVMDAGDDIDIIRGEQGDDALTGGGGGDIFKMRGTDGHDTITDFEPLSDVVEFQIAGITGFLDLLFSQDLGGNPLVTAGPVSVTFLGASLADIQQADNFAFI